MNSRYPVSRLFSLLLLPFLFTAVGNSTSSAQTPDPEKTAVAVDEGTTVKGLIRVKIKRDRFFETIGPEFFGTTGRLLGVSNVRPWLNRDLLRYADKSSALYKSNGRSYESWGNSLSRIMVIEYTADVSPATAALHIAELTDVEYAEPVWERRLCYTPNDPDVQTGKLWHLAQIKAYQAWDIRKGDSTILIGITDTGIEPDHRDLRQAIWYNPGEAGEKRNNGIDDDGNGLIDDWRGYDFAGADGNSPDNDPDPVVDWHGTHVAGIAGATGDNDIGVAGVAYGVKLMSIKIAEDGADPPLPGGFDGILYGASMGARVINCSWGGTGKSIAEQEVITAVTKNLGVLVVAAAGNNNKEQLFYPASYRHVISVAGTKQDDGKWSGSNYQYRVDLSAPGNAIRSTVFNDGYGDTGGTSMATPMVSAGAALLLLADPLLSPEEVGEILRATTDPLSPLVIAGYENKLGTGRLNLQKALTQRASIASARMVSYTADDGNSDGIIDPGETVVLRGVVRNILADADNVSLTVESVFPFYPIEGTTVDFGVMSSGQQMTTPGDKLRIQIPPTAAPDTRLRLKVTVTTEDRSNVEFVELIVFPTWQTTSLNSITSTFNSVGNIAYNGTNRNEGEGFYFGSKGSLLWHAGLMMGTEARLLNDVVRKGASDLGTDENFVLITPYRLTRDDANTVETGEAVFRDEGHQYQVTMTTKEFRDENYVLVFYKIKNMKPTRIDNLFCGLYLDWDLTSLGTGDHASWDPTRRMGFVRNLPDPDNTPVAGAALLSPQQPNYYAANSRGDDNYILTDFNDTRKWNMLSNGVSRENTPTVGLVDASMTIGGGPVSIEPDETVTVAFALMAANDISELQATADAAKEQYDQISSVPVIAGEATGINLAVSPTPFRDGTTIFLNLEGSERLSIEIFNLSGERIATLHDGILGAGEQLFRFEAKEPASGMYVVRVAGEKGVVEKKMLLVR